MEALSASMEVVLNGARCSIATASTVAMLLQARGLPERGIAVEVDGEIVPRSTWGERVLEPGNRIEIVHMVGGGA